MVADAPGQVSRDAIQALLTRIGAAWTELTGVLDAIPEERQSESGVTGDWSVKDLVGHVAFWLGHHNSNAKRLLRGEPAARIDWKDVNQLEIDKRASLTPSEARTELEREHARVVQILSDLQPDNPVAAKVLEEVEEDATDHIHEHLAEIRAWWERAGS